MEHVPFTGEKQPLYKRLTDKLEIATFKKAIEYFALTISYLRIQVALRLL